MYQNSMVMPSATAPAATDSTPPSASQAEVTTSTLTSRFSLIKRGKPSTTPAPPLDPKCGSEAMNGRGSGGVALGSIGLGGLSGLVGGLGGGGIGGVKDTGGGVGETGRTEVGITGGFSGESKGVVGIGGSSSGVVIDSDGGSCNIGGSGSATTATGATAVAEEGKSETPWEKMFNQLTSNRSDGKFFDVLRIPGVKNVRQNPTNESVL